MRFTPRFIATEGNFPKLYLISAKYLRLLVGIQNMEPNPKIDPTGKIVSELMDAELLALGPNNQMLNKTMIIQVSDGESLFALAKRHSPSIQKVIEFHLEAIKNKVSGIREFAEQPFLNFSFLILSNVILDNWQIQNIEELYLKQDRPLRGGKRFYFAMMEGLQDGRDPFGIYGNISRTVELNTCCYYGNNQQSLSSLDFEEMLQREDVLMLSQNAKEELSKVALIVREDLIHFFNQIDHELRDFHSKSNWANISYAEFFIWWYHFLYTQATNDLAQTGILKIPEDGMYPYRIENR